MNTPQKEQGRVSERTLEEKSEEWESGIGDVKKGFGSSVLRRNKFTAESSKKK